MKLQRVQFFIFRCFEIKVQKNKFNKKRKIYSESCLKYFKYFLKNSHILRYSLTKIANNVKFQFNTKIYNGKTSYNIVCYEI